MDDERFKLPRLNKDEKQGLRILAAIFIACALPLLAFSVFGFWRIVFDALESRDAYHRAPVCVSSQTGMSDCRLELHGTVLSVEHTGKHSTVVTVRAAGRTLESTYDNNLDTAFSEGSPARVELWRGDVMGITDDTGAFIRMSDNPDVQVGDNLPPALFTLVFALILLAVGAGILYLSFAMNRISDRIERRPLVERARKAIIAGAITRTFVGMVALVFPLSALYGVNDGPPLYWLAVSLIGVNGMRGLTNGLVISCFRGRRDGLARGAPSPSEKRWKAGVTLTYAVLAAAFCILFLRSNPLLSLIVAAFAIPSVIALYRGGRFPTDQSEGPGKSTVPAQERPRSSRRKRRQRHAH